MQLFTLEPLTEQNWLSWEHTQPPPVYVPSNPSNYFPSTAQLLGKTASFRRRQQTGGSTCYFVLDHYDSGEAAPLDFMVGG